MTPPEEHPLPMTLFTKLNFVFIGNLPNDPNESGFIAALKNLWRRISDEESLAKIFFAKSPWSANAEAEANWRPLLVQLASRTYRVYWTLRKENSKTYYKSESNIISGISQMVKLFSCIIKHLLPAIRWILFGVVRSCIVCLNKRGFCCNVLRRARWIFTRVQAFKTKRQFQQIHVQRNHRNFRVRHSNL